MKKRFWFILLVILFCQLILSGCGTTDKNSVLENIEASPTPSEIPTPTIMVSPTPEPLYSLIKSDGAFPKPAAYGDLYEKLNSNEKWLLTDDGIKSRINYIMEYFDISEIDAVYLIASFYDWNYTALNPVNFNNEDEASTIKDWLTYIFDRGYSPEEDNISYVIDKYKSGEGIYLDDWKDLSISELISFYKNAEEETGDIHNIEDNTGSSETVTEGTTIKPDSEEIADGLSNEKKFEIAASMNDFIFDDTVRNIYNIGSLYTGNLKWILVSGSITDLKMIGMVDNVPSYRGIITVSELFDEYQIVFTYTGDDFSYIKGDYISAYATITSDAPIDHYNNQGIYVDSSQSIEICIYEHSSDYQTGNYEMNDTEKLFYLNKTYNSESGKSIYFTLEKVGDFSIHGVKISKYGDGHIAIEFKYSDQTYSKIHKNDVILLYPYGQLSTTTDDFHYGIEQYYLPD